MKRLILFAVNMAVLSVGSLLVGQELSPEGRGHYKAAMTLFDMASSVSDYEGVAAEFEKVAQTDPGYADTYINLCKIYGRIGVDKGDGYFDKAKDALEKYRQLSSDKEVYGDELIVLDALKAKNASRIRKSFTGHWKWGAHGDLTISYENGGYTATVAMDNWSVRGVDFVDGCLLLSVTKCTDWQRDGDGEQYYIHYDATHRNGVAIRYTKEYDYREYRVWNENGEIYMSLVSSYSDYYYFDRKVHTDPVWDNLDWASSDWRFKLKKCDIHENLHPYR